MYFGTINYVYDLIKNNRRDKARAFWEYCYDMEHSIHNVDYASSWGIDDNLANVWISEFYAAINDEIKNSKAKHLSHTKAL